MNENLEAIRKEWRGGGLKRCLAGEDNYTPPYAFNIHGRVIKWGFVRGTWTAEEDAVLTKQYGGKGSLGCLAACPTKTKDQIRSRAQRLGLQTEQRGPRGRQGLKA